MFKKLLNLFKKIFNFQFTEKESEVNYLSLGEALPKALKPNEEKELVSKVMENKDEVAKQKLIEHNLRLVIYIAKKFENTDADMEDLISIGSIGLIKAINSFKGEKNIKIATYASRCIENEILMYLRKISKLKKEVSLNEPINCDSEGNELLITDLVSNEDVAPQSEFEKQTEVQILWSVLNKLNSRERLIMVMRFGLDGDNEKTQKEVADDLGISQSYISRLEKKILSRIKKEILKLA